MMWIADAAHGELSREASTAIGRPPDPARACASGKDEGILRHELRPEEIDAVFCWRTITGGIRDGARDTTFNGHPVRYEPSRRTLETGLCTVVHGRPRGSARPPSGFRLNDQSSTSRMACFVAGYVTRAQVVPARDEGELDRLRHAAGDAVRSGAATEWAMVAIHARRQRFPAVHVDGPPAVVAELAALVDAPWTLVVHEKVVDFRMDGAQIACLNRDGSTIVTLEADTRFRSARLLRVTE